MNVIAVVQARMSSKRLPGKALAEISWRTALDHLLDRATAPGYRVIVATTNDPEDHPIRRLAEDRGVTGFTLPEGETSASVPLRLFSAAMTFRADHIIRITGDDILVEPEYMERAVNEHLASEAHFTHMPGLAKGFDCEVISKKALQTLCEEFTEDELIGDLLTDPRWFTIHTVEVDKEHRRPDIRLELNTEDDLSRLKTVFAALYRSGRPPFGLDDVLEMEDELQETLTGVAA